MSHKIDISEIMRRFSSRQLKNEDDVKINAYADIFSPIQKKFSPHSAFSSEHRYVKGGRADGTIANLAIEYKKDNYFSKQKGIDEALFGRNQKKNDSGLYQYIINSALGENINETIFDTFGIGFDGRTWLFARFIPSNVDSEIDLKFTRFFDENQPTIQFPAKFDYKKMNFEDGLNQLITLFTSTNKIKITKEKLGEVFNPKNLKINTSVLDVYEIIKKELEIPVPQRTTTLYNEWNKSFGTMFGEEEQETEFNETSEAIRKLYNIPDSKNIDSKIFLFSLQTYFNIFLKLLIDGFLRQIHLPSEATGFRLEWGEIAELFEGRDTRNSTYISNFFEIHYYEWFTYVSQKEDIQVLTEVINSVIELLDVFDLATYKVRPETVQDILQEVYMTLIPSEVRHLLGEYFSPDWIVEFALNKVNYSGDIQEKIIDPTCGSGAFLIQALKRIIENKHGKISQEDALKITENVIGFDLNPISAVSAKANYILTLFSSLEFNKDDKIVPLSIPIYISDSVLSPIVYSEESVDTFIADTTVGKFEIPKFDNFGIASNFLTQIGDSIEFSRSFKTFEALVLKNYSLNSVQLDATKALYNQLIVLHRSAQDSFWGKILKNSFAPVMLKQRFDFVVGNPPWIAWKAMSKTYREGTLDVWKSYGIFEKNAYDKKTTHDDFGMAVTYVALDQYLKDGGILFFLLPWTFIKSTKGGEGFRKFEITRNGQSIPIKVKAVDDFNKVKIFKPKHTSRTIGLTLQKGVGTEYPFKNWTEWNYKGKAVVFDAHSKWTEVKKKLISSSLYSKPINSNDLQSAWLTLPKVEISLIDHILLNGKEPNYKGRKGIEPAGAKGIYLLKKPVIKGVGKLEIVNDISRQRREDLLKRGAHKGIVENTFVYPMLGGRNIQRWLVKSNEFMIVPHKITTPYGLKDEILAKEAPLTYKWLEYFKQGLLASRIQSGKFFNPDTQPWYRLDNVGTYTFSPYKVLWKEQSASFAAVAIGEYSTLPTADLSLFDGLDKVVVLDSKVLMLETKTMDEAYFVSGVLNSKSVRDVIDAYAVGLNRGIDVLENIFVPEFEAKNELHKAISEKSKQIHLMVREQKIISKEEKELNELTIRLYGRKIKESEK